MIQIDPLKIRYFQNTILDWFESNHRTFEWRKSDASPYLIIISEILLQRTKADTVSKFLPQFLKQFPSWEVLSIAPEEDIIWALKPVGLYNQKGKRLYNLSQKIKNNGGELPKNKEAVAKLPLIGQYIANAFELFILGNPSPLLDVNMARVLERFFGERKLADIRYDPYLQDLSREVVNHKKSKELNWAVLDFGALVCKKIKPSCLRCPLNEECKFYNEKRK